MIKITRILFPTDFSQNASVALAYACALAEQNNAELHVLHAIDVGRLAHISEFVPMPDADFESIYAAAKQSLADVVDREWAEKHKVVHTIGKGPPFLEILRHAKERSIDLIVMSTHGRTGLSHLLIGSVAENVVRKAPCPVLTVHPADHTFVMP